MPRLQPPSLHFREDGTPYSTVYGDVYHTRAGGPEQAQQVFMRGNDLPQRWQARETFCIVETGFGLGVNFLATWESWRKHHTPGARLHFISTELHPFPLDVLRHAHRQWPEWAEFSAQLLQHWPELTPGMHRIHLDDGSVVLTLLFGDARKLLPELECRADAFYLDGFAPAKNPEIWSVGLLSELARLAAAGATLATWSVSGAVRRGLAAAGFRCEKIPGFGGKREQLAAVFDKPVPAPAQGMRHAAIVGAGLAGTALANRLAERGWRVDLLEAGSEPGRGASGNLAGVLRPLPSLDDNRLARLTRAGTLYGLRHLRRLQAMGLPVRWDACGVLHLARDALHEARMKEIVDTHGYPRRYLQYVDRLRASQLAEWPLAAGGWWFPLGAWVNPPSLCAANLQGWSEALRTRFNCKVSALQRAGGDWQIFDEGGACVVTAPIVILAGGAQILDLPQAETLPVRAARGQVSHLPGERGPAVVVCRGGYVSPAVDGVISVGASFSVDDDEPELRAHDHLENLARLDDMLPGHPASSLAVASGRVGFRPASPDRLPMVGAVPIQQPVTSSDTLEGLRYHPDLFAITGFGARGLVWSALAAETLACQLNGEPLPLERSLVEAMAPARYLLRKARKAGTTA